MNLHSVFLRKECVLPNRLNPSLQHLGDAWSLVEETPALAFDTMVRQAGWHFLWLQGACSRRGFGLKQEVAIRRALLRALKGIPKQFNAAELDSVLVTDIAGVLIVNVTVQTLQIQEHASLNIAYHQHLHTIPAKQAAHPGP